MVSLWSRHPPHRIPRFGRVLGIGMIDQIIQSIDPLIQAQQRTLLRPLLPAAVIEGGTKASATQGRRRRVSRERMLILMLVLMIVLGREEGTS